MMRRTLIALLILALLLFARPIQAQYNTQTTSGVTVYSGYYPMAGWWGYLGYSCYWTYGYYSGGGYYVDTCGGGYGWF